MTTKSPAHKAHDELYLWFLANPAQPELIGTLNLVNPGNGVSLRYSQSWLKSGVALSEDLPLIDTEFLPRTRDVAVSAVDDARPDRWGERVIRFIDKPVRLSLMEYLYYAGDDRFGALGVSTSGNVYLPRLIGPLPRLQDAQQLSDIVSKIKAKEAITEVEKKMMVSGGSFGGAKPKALIEINGEQWLIKFFNNEPIDLPLVEHATMTLCKKADIAVADTQTAHLEGAHAIVIRRFDRQDGKRVHCISAGTALRAAAPKPEQAEMSYSNLAQLLRRSGDALNNKNQKQMGELFRRMIFNILMDNTDDHEKNHALFVKYTPVKAGSSIRTVQLELTPAYDVLPTNSGQGYQEFGIGDNGHDSTLENAMTRCRLFGFTPPEAAAEVAKVIAVVDTWKEHFRSCSVSDADILELAGRIDSDDLLSQRRGFRVEAFVDEPPRTRRGPFSKPGN